MMRDLDEILSRRYVNFVARRFLLDMSPMFGVHNDNIPEMPRIRFYSGASRILPDGIDISRHESETNSRKRLKMMAYDCTHELGHYLHDQLYAPDYNPSCYTVQEVVAELAAIQFFDLNGGIEVGWKS